MNTKTWQEEKINHTAEHIGIISRGVLETLVREVIAKTREETIREVENEIENWEIVDGKSFTSDKIKHILNTLKKQST